MNTNKHCKEKKMYYGWLIVALCSLAYFFSGPGQTYFLSIFIDYYVADFGWSRSAISSLYTLATLLSGIILFSVGKLTDKFGQKKILIIVVIILALTCIWNSFITSLWMLFIGFFIGRYTGQGSIPLITSTIIPNWFTRKRAIAFSMLSLGHIIASAVVPPLNTFLINIMSWTTVWRLWAVLLFFVLTPLILFLLYNKPEDKNLIPYNGIDYQSSQQELSENWTLKESLGTRSFWGMAYCQSLLPLINTGLVFHFISIMGSKGLTPLQASAILSVIALTSFPANILAGFALEKVRIHVFFSFISFLILLSLIVLLFPINLYTALAFGTLQGVTLGFKSVTSNTLWPNYYGTKHLASIKSIVFAITIVASAIGPLPLGLAYDYTGSYDIAIIIFMVLPLIGIFLALLSPMPIKKVLALE